MFVEIFVDGLDKPQLIEISKASSFCSQVERMGKNTRLGKTVH